MVKIWGINFFWGNCGLLRTIMETAEPPSPPGLDDYLYAGYRISGDISAGFTVFTSGLEISNSGYASGASTVTAIVQDDDYVYVGTNNYSSGVYPNVYQYQKSSNLMLVNTLNTSGTKITCMENDNYQSGYLYIIIQIPDYTYILEKIQKSDLTIANTVNISGAWGYCINCDSGYCYATGGKATIPSVAKIKKTDWTVESMIDWVKSGGGMVAPMNICNDDKYIYVCGDTGTEEDAGVFAFQKSSGLMLSHQVLNVSGFHTFNVFMDITSGYLYCMGYPDSTTTKWMAKIQLSDNTVLLSGNISGTNMAGGGPKCYSQDADSIYTLNHYSGDFYKWKQLSKTDFSLINQTSSYSIPAGLQTSMYGLSQIAENTVQTPTEPDYLYCSIRFSGDTDAGAIALDTDTMNMVNGSGIYEHTISLQELMEDAYFVYAKGTKTSGYYTNFYQYQKSSGLMTANNINVSGNISNMENDKYVSGYFYINVVAFDYSTNIFKKIQKSDLSIICETSDIVGAQLRSITCDSGYCYVCAGTFSDPGFYKIQKTDCASNMFIPFANSGFMPLAQYICNDENYVYVAGTTGTAQENGIFMHQKSSGLMLANTIKFSGFYPYGLFNDVNSGYLYYISYSTSPYILAKIQKSDYTVTLSGSVSGYIVGATSEKVWAQDTNNIYITNFTSGQGYRFKKINKTDFSASYSDFYKVPNYNETNYIYGLSKIDDNNDSH